VKSRILFGAAVVAATACVVSTSAAYAEPPIGSRLGDRQEKQARADERSAIHAAHELAGCIVVKRGSVARGVLDSREAEQLTKFESRTGGELDCIANIEGNDLMEGVSVSYPRDIMRGDLAEELIERNRASVQQLQPLPIEKTYARPWFALTGRHVSVDEMAACVANTNPAAIIGLIDAEPVSDAENAAFQNLIPLMGPCLVAGTKLDAKREPLRAALAEALYQRWAHPQENVSGGQHPSGSQPK
jgi:hypothetical protein